MELGFSPDTIALLKGRGHDVEIKGSNNDMNMILFGTGPIQMGPIQAGIDPRRDGKAAGY
jgi:gamma-glutamyltranspeptidase